MQKIWNVKNPNPRAQKILSDELSIHPIISQLLINRGIVDPKEAKEFLNADVDDAPDPFLFLGMKEAVARIKRASQEGEKVLVFGDYDVDGVVSSYLLQKVLKEMNVDVINHIPHRMQHGYGLNHEIGEFAREQGVSLIITIDCGITAVDEVDFLNGLGMDIIIFDHHEPPDGVLPKAVAIVNPKQQGCPYPHKELASVGLVYKITQALTGRMPKDILDLVAIGTITDVVPLTGENRVFVKAGLPFITKTENKGLLALLEITKIKDKKLTPFHIGFVIGPRINAAGRMDSAHTSLDLLLSETKEEALGFAKILEKFNVDRQKMQREVVEEAIAIVEQEVNFKDHKVIVLSKEGWHKGILGIVASRLTEKYYRPSIVISVNEGVGTASARSIDGFHLHDALANCSVCLENFGGHEGAAGLTIKSENIDPFRNMINEVADKLLELKKLTPIISMDCEIPLSAITMEFVEILNQLEPYGEGNPEPLFFTRQLAVKGYSAVLGKDTLKFYVTDGKNTLSAVGFGLARYRDMIAPGEKIDLAYQIIIDDWNKAPTPQLKIKDIRLSE